MVYTKLRTLMTMMNDGGAVEKIYVGIWAISPQHGYWCLCNPIWFSDGYWILDSIHWILHSSACSRFITVQQALLYQEVELVAMFFIKEIQIHMMILVFACYASDVQTKQYLRLHIDGGCWIKDIRIRWCLKSCYEIANKFLLPNATHF